MEFKEVVKNRYSCKKFKSEQIKEGSLTEILEAGQMAPTAKNLQEQHIYVVNTKEGLEKIDEITPCRYNAPTVLIVAYDKTNVFTYPGGRQDSGAEDATIVATHMILAAYNAGVDSCWLNFFDPDKCKEVFGLPKNEEVLMLMDLGYGDLQPLENHFSRKELKETVTYVK